MHRIRKVLICILGVAFIVRAVFSTWNDRNNLKGSQPYFEASGSYDWGFYGSKPQHRYHTYYRQSIKPNIVRNDERCHTGLLFVEPQTQAALQPLMVFDNGGNLVWMPLRSELYHATDFKVQNLNGQNYITFLNGKDVSDQEEVYVMLDDRYRIIRTIRAVGNITGHLSGLHITQAGSALITIDQKPKDIGNDNAPAKAFDTIFQDIDLAHGALLFQWSASEHPLTTARAKYGQYRIKSVDKHVDGSYLISVGDAIICLGNDGNILWQLGGDGNDFEDFAGAAMEISLDHHARWYTNTTLMIINDNLSGLQYEVGKGYNAAVFVQLDLDKKSASLVRRISIPHELLSSSSAFQVLDDHILVQDLNAHTVVELLDNETLCELHFAPNWLPKSWNPRYHISKFEWTGRPDTPPQISVLSEENAVYVSWNGATDIDSWVLQSGPKENGDAFIDHVRVPKAGFETRIELPKRTEEYIRVVALDQKWKMASYSAAASKYRTSATNSNLGTGKWHSRGRNLFTLPFLVIFLAPLSIVAYCCRRWLLVAGADGEQPSSS